MVVALSTGATTGWAQEPRIVGYSVGEGLPSSEIFDLAEDRLGRLLVLARSGLVAYDGRAFDPVAGFEEVAALEPSELMVDGAGGTWVAGRTSTGEPAAARLVGEGWLRLPPLPNPPEEPGRGGIVGLASDEHGRRRRVVLAEKSGRLWIWDGERWRRAADASRIHALDRGASGVVLATDLGLCRLVGTEVECGSVGGDPRLAAPLFALYPEAVAGGGTRLWLLGSGWLGYLEGGELRVTREDFELPFPLREGRVRLVADRAGGAYLGNRHAAYFVDPADGSVHRLSTRHGMAAEGATTIWRDREGNVWIGGLRGLSRIESRRFESLDEEHGLLEGEVTAVAEWAPGRLVLGHNTGLTILGPDGAETLPFDRSPLEPLNLTRVLDLAVGDAGEVWVAAHQLGLLRLDPGRRELRRVPLPEPSVFSVEVDRRGTLWVASPTTLYRRGEEGMERVEIGANPRGFGHLRWLATTSEGHLLIALRGGLRWNDGHRWHRAHGPSPEADNVYTLLADPGGRVWAGTGAGLFELRGDRLEKVRTGPVIDRPVYFLFRDPEGHLWCGTDDGVVVWDGGRLRRLTFQHGLVGRETNRGAGLVDHRGRLWIGTDQGVSIYRREYDLPSAAPPAVSLANLEVDGVRHLLDAAVDLDPDPGTLAFHPRVVAFSRRRAVRLRYRLDGFDPGWIGPASSAAVPIRYTNVPPGRYRFQVMAGWPEGPWSGEVTSATITIARPLWRRGWFLALLALAAGAVILGAHQLRLQAVRGRNRELETLNRQLEREVAERRRMETEREELIADLEAKNVELERFTYTVSHDLKSPLVTIQGFLGLLRRDVEAGDAERAAHDAGRIESAAGRMGTLLDELLELSRIGRVVHPEEPVPLDELVHETVQLLAGPIVARAAEVLVVDRRMPVVFGDRVRILEVFQNLIENALKFMGEQPEPRIEIGAEARGDQVLCTVRDNGVGIEAEYLEKVFGLFERLTPEVEGTGVGLAIVRRIVELHGGRIWVESEGAGRGAAFRFTLPRWTSKSS